MLFTDIKKTEDEDSSDEFTSMTFVRFIDWLTNKDVSDKDILDCIYYIASGTNR